MRTQVTRTVAGCFAVLRQLRSIRRSVPDPVFQSLVVSLVLTKLDYGNATLAGLPAYQYRRLQSVLYAAARLIYQRRRFDHVSSLLRELHWLKSAERVALQVGSDSLPVPSWLGTELSHPQRPSCCRVGPSSPTFVVV